MGSQFVPKEVFNSRVVTDLEAAVVSPTRWDNFVLEMEGLLAEILLALTPKLREALDDPDRRSSFIDRVSFLSKCSCTALSSHLRHRFFSTTVN